MRFIQPLGQFHKEQCSMMKRFIYTLMWFVYMLLNGRHLREFSTDDVIARLPSIEWVCFKLLKLTLCVQKLKSIQIFNKALVLIQLLHKPCNFKMLGCCQTGCISKSRLVNDCILQHGCILQYCCILQYGNLYENLCIFCWSQLFCWQKNWIKILVTIHICK